MTVQNAKLKTDASLLILVILFLIPVYLIKIKSGWFSFNVLELLIAILFLLWIFNKQKKGIIHNTSYIIPVSLILAGLILSTLANKNFHSGFGAIKGWFTFPLIFTVVFFDVLKKDESLLKKSLLALFCSGVAVSVIGIIYKILGIVTYDNRLKIFWDSPNQLAMFLAVPFLIGISRVNPSYIAKVDSWKKLAMIFGLALIFLNLYFTQSFGAWLAITTALLVFFGLKYRKIWQKKYLAIILTILLIFLGRVGLSKLEDIKSLGDRSSLASRFTIWRSAGLMVKNNPLFGIGPVNFQNKYLEYQKYFPPYLEWSVPQPHNIFLAFWLESGLVGLIGFVWLSVLFFRDNKKAIENDCDLGILFLAIMIYTFIHGLVDTTYWRNDLAVVFWLVIAANVYLANMIEN